jgi:hypothetical protein
MCSVEKCMKKIKTKRNQKEKEKETKAREQPQKLYYLDPASTGSVSPKKKNKKKKR